MSRSDESVVYWKDNVTLRQFSVVSSFCWFGFGGDLTLNALTQQGDLTSGLLVWLQTTTGLPVFKFIYEWLPADSMRLHLYTAYSLPAVGLISLILLDRLANQETLGFRGALRSVADCSLWVGQFWIWR